MSGILNNKNVNLLRLLWNWLAWVLVLFRSMDRPNDWLNEWTGDENKIVSILIWFVWMATAATTTLLVCANTQLKTAPNILITTMQQ